MRMVFISSIPFGLIATPGTYLLVDAYAEHMEVCVISKKEKNDPFAIVHKASKKAILREVEFGAPDYLQQIAAIVREFAPDIVNMTSFPGWMDIVSHVKQAYPSAKYVYDIKSPLLAGKNSKRAMGIRSKGQQAGKFVDLVLSRSPEDVFTWFPQEPAPVVVYPLGVQLEAYAPKSPEVGIPSCRRFVYIGSIAPLRRLDRMLELIAALSGDLREKTAFDFYGSGPAEQAFVEQIASLGLQGCVHFKGCVDSSVLSGLLSDYDAGLAWVPHDLYDTSPSLKVVEYVAAGLLPVATDTTAHKRFAALGFACEFFGDDAASFQKCIVRCIEKGFPREKRIANLRRIKDYSWNAIVARHILPRLEKMLRKEPDVSEGRSAADTTEKPGFKRLLYISPRQFGLIGTAGTYMSVDAYSRHMDVRVIANSHEKENKHIVFESRDKDRLHEIDFSRPDVTDRILEIVESYDPQVVFLGNYARWTRIFNPIKRRFPHVRLAMDVQTPLITSGEEDAAYRRIQKDGTANQGLIDMILAYSPEAVPTWLPEWSGKTLVYPMGIKVDSFSPKKREDERIVCSRFVYVGSIHPLRRLDKLVELVAALPRKLKKRFEIDFYGDGPAIADLERQAAAAGLEGVVRFKGVLPADKLAVVLSGYDAGIAWVPHSVYEFSPSLKLIEYFAAGLVPVATNTVAHKRYTEMGFHVEFFDETPETFAASIERITRQGFPLAWRNENLRAAKQLDWDYIAVNHVLPGLTELVTGGAPPPAPRGHDPRPAASDGLVLGPSRRRVAFLLFSVPGCFRNMGGWRLPAAVSTACDVLVVCPEDGWDQVFDASEGFQIAPMRSDRFMDRIRDAGALLRVFNPDVVHVVHSSETLRLLYHLRPFLPGVRAWVLDVLEALPKDVRDRCRIRADNFYAQFYVDKILAPASSLIKSHIPFCFRGSDLLGPLVEFNFVRPKALPKDGAMVPCTNFVFLGQSSTPEAVRRVIEAFIDARKQVEKKITLTIFSDDQTAGELRKFIADRGAAGFIQLTVGIAEKGLLARLRNFEAGLVDASAGGDGLLPPREGLIFAACGLPFIATDTPGVRDLRSRGRLKMVLSRASTPALADTLASVAQRGMPAADIAGNMAEARRFDVQSVITQQLLPLYARLTHKPF